MADTYWATLAVCGFSLAVGQAGLALCGVRRLSWLAPAVGLALLSALSWGTVRLPGHGLTALVILFAIFVAAILVLRGRSYDGAAEGELSTGLIVAVLALLAASLPFAVEGHFGILGTGFNPDMSQHLLATDRLADGHSSQLLDQGYPLGPHAIVVAVYGGGIVQGFDGLTIAVAVIASLTALAAFDSAPRPHRVAGALVVGLTYMAASYLAQGSFKETMQALFVLAFVLALREASRPELRELPLRFVPAGLIAVGSVYAYSYPGLVWLAGAAGIWLAVELLRGRFEAASLGSAPWRALGLGLLAFAILVAPEVGRMIEFRRFETFDPDGPGLGNLFDPISPFEALGIWPSGDFRLSPGDGAVPAVGYYLGAAFAAILLLYGLFLCWRRRETAVLAGLGAVLAVYAAAELVGTPYTAAKAIAIAAPVAVLVILLPLLRRPVGRPLRAGGRRLLAARPRQRAGRADRLLAGPHRPAPARRRRLDPRPRLRPPARRGTRRALPGLGAARRPRLHRPRYRGAATGPWDPKSPRVEWGGVRRPASATSSPKTASAGRPSPACACAATPTHTCSGKPRGPRAARETAP